MILYIHFFWLILWFDVCVGVLTTRPKHRELRKVTWLRTDFSFAEGKFVVRIGQDFHNGSGMYFRC